MMKTETIQLLRDVREFARQPYTWPGGYPKILLMRDGGTICPACARGNLRQVIPATMHGGADDWQAVAVDIHWEGAPIECAHCGVEIESAYGSDDE